MKISDPITPKEKRMLREVGILLIAAVWGVTAMFVYWDFITKWSKTPRW